MQLRPRYDGRAVIRVDGPVGDLATPLVRQRRRLAASVSDLTEAEWAAQSRCAEWSVRDVLAHLVGVDAFWLRSIAGGLEGKPTRYLAEFDPVATPMLGVVAMRQMASEEILNLFVAGVEALAGIVSDLDDAQWSLPAEAPPGHIAISLLARHALWDAWIHERDVAIPLGIASPVEADEVCASLAYVAALGPAILAIGGSTRTGALVIDAVDPEAHIVVEVGEQVVIHEGAAPPGAVALAGRSVDLVEALSFRAPLRADIGAEHRWLLGALDEVFEVSERY